MQNQAWQATDKMVTSMQQRTDTLNSVDASIRRRLANLESTNAEVKAFMQQPAPSSVSRLLNDARQGKDSSINPSGIPTSEGTRNVK